MDLSLFGGQYMTYPKGNIMALLILIVLTVTPHEDWARWEGQELIPESIEVESVIVAMLSFIHHKETIALGWNAKGTLTKIYGEKRPVKRGWSPGALTVGGEQLQAESTTI